MRRSRSAVTASLAAVASLVLAACTSASSATTGASGDDENKIVINALFSDYDFPGIKETLTKRAAEFSKKHPEYKVNAQFDYYRQLPEAVAKSALSDQAPTIAAYNTSATQFARDAVGQDGKPLFTPVQDAIADRDEILGEPVVVDDLIPAGKRYYSYEGKLYAMPLSLSTLHLYANKTLLDKAGVEGVPQTWAEVTAACTALAKIDTPPKHCVAFPNESKLFQQALTQQGALFSDQDNGRSGRSTTIDLTSPELVGFVTWWQQLNKAGYFLNTGKTEDFAGTFEAFMSQQAVFTITSSFVLNMAESGSQRAGFELAAGPTPVREKPAVGAWLGGEGMYLKAGLDEKTQDGALAFMQYVNNPENGAEWHRVYGSSPVTNGVYEELEAEGWYKEHPLHQVTVDQINATTEAPGGQATVVGGYAGIQEALIRAVDDVLEKGADPLQRLTRADAFAQELLTDYNDHCLAPGGRPSSCFVTHS